MNMFSLDQKTLLLHLSGLQPICTKRTTIDATSSILFQVGHKELILKSTDLEISVQSNCIVQESTIFEPYSFLVSGKRIFDLVKELDGLITFFIEENKLKIQCGKVNLSLHIKNPDEFPPFPERIENLMQLDAKFLLKLLDKVAFLIPQNNANPALNGLFLEINPQQLTMTSTDGHCLAQVTTSDYTLDSSKKWLIPKKAIVELKKILDATDTKELFLGICGNQLVFSGESFNLFTKLLADKFPTYDPIMQHDDFIPAKVDRSQLIKTLRRSVCLLSGQFIATEFNFEQNKLHIQMQNNEVGSLNELVPLHDFEISPLAIRFYAPYLLNGLQVFIDEQITFYLKAHSNPIIFKSTSENYQVIYLVMPVSPSTTNV